MVLKGLLENYIDSEKAISVVKKLTFYINLHPDFSSEKVADYEMTEEIEAMKRKIHQYLGLKVKKKRRSGAKKRGRRKQRLREQAAAEAAK